MRWFYFAVGVVGLPLIAWWEAHCYGVTWRFSGVVPVEIPSGRVAVVYALAIPLNAVMWFGVLPYVMWQARQLRRELIEEGKRWDRLCEEWERIHGRPVERSDLE